MILQIVVAIVVVVGGVILAGPRLLRRIAERQIEAEVESVRAFTPADADPLFAGLDPARPALLYFTADWCAPCRTTQKPIIERLLAQHGDTLQLREIDVVADPDAAARWQVKGLPRTVVLRPGLTVHAANVGVASEQTLGAQIKAAHTADASAPVAVTREEIAEKERFRFKFRDPS